MGRPRKPTALLELNGAFKEHPARRRERENEPQGNPEVGDPPAAFLRPDSPSAAAHLEIWRRLIAEAPPGCITGSDRTLLANACRLQHKIDRGSTSPSDHNMMARYLAGFGMSGEGRARRGVKGKGSAESKGTSDAWASYIRDFREA